MLKSVSSALLIISMASFSHATSDNVAVLDENYYKISTVQVENLGTEDDFSALAPLMSSSDCTSNDFQSLAPMSLSPVEEITATIDQAETVLDRIVNLGRKVISLVAEGRPVYSTNMEVAHAMPKGVACWLDLSGWSMPRSTNYRISYKNLYGMTVVDFKYRVTFVYGGRMNEAGAYIAQATVAPASLNVAWGFKFNAEAKIPIVYNMGSRKDPVAGMQVDIKWSIDTLLEHTEQTDSYGISGLGEITKL